MRKRYLVLIGLVLLVAIVVSLWLYSPDESGKLKIGYLPISAGVPLFVAVEEGFFEAEGFDVELVRFRDSNQIASAAVNARIDLIGTGATNAMLDASSQSSTQLTIFLANLYIKRPGEERASDALLARSGIEKVEDLRGKTVAFFPGSVGRVFASEILPKYDLTIDDLNYVEMPPPQWFVALKSGAIDAVTSVEPFTTQMLKAGVGHILIDGYYAEALPDVPASGAWFIEGMLSDSEEEKVVRAYRKALDFIEAKPREARLALKNYVPTDPEILMQIPLNEWELTTDETTAERCRQFAELFYSAGALQVDPSGQDWIWHPE